MRFIILVKILIIAGLLLGNAGHAMEKGNKNMSTKEKQIVLGGGCFWCIEAVFNMTKGVSSAVSGYAGGQTKNPTYEEVCRGTTGHAEVVKITYNQDIVSLDEILDIFFTIHDPTQKNRQG